MLYCISFFLFVVIAGSILSAPVFLHTRGIRAVKQTSYHTSVQKQTVHHANTSKAQSVPSDIASSQAPQSSSTDPASEPQPEAPALTDSSSFKNSAFVGNSILSDIDTYGIIGNADFYARSGLTVDTVFTKSTLKGHIPVIDELDGKHYGKIYLMFGLNELGWAYSDVFIDDYGKVIDAVKLRQPSAKIYVMAILPVSAKTSARNKNSINNTRIHEYNMLIQKMAQQKRIQYIDASAKLTDAKGCLYANAASDGIHPNINYSKIYINALSTETK